MLSRAVGALYGLAIGDALGMPTQSLPRPAALVEDFAPGPADHPLAAGLPAGHVTDDTEQAVLLARLLISSGGTVDGAELARQLLEWEDSMRARGSLDLLGPSTKRAVAALAAGEDPAITGRTGTTNGAAMRITPVGIAVADPDALLDLVVAASAVTHGTGLALSGAAAVAAAVSAGIDGATVPEIVPIAIAAAARVESRGHWVAGASVAARIAWASSLFPTPASRHIPAAESSHSGAYDRAADLICTLVGTSLATQESVPAAFAVLAVAGHDPWLTCRLAASLGGDTDTIAAMAGAIAGACHGVEAFPDRAPDTIDAVNGLPLRELAAALLELRCSTG